MSSQQYSLTIPADRPANLLALAVRSNTSPKEWLTNVVVEGSILDVKAPSGLLALWAPKELGGALPYAVCGHVEVDFKTGIVTFKRFPPHTRVTIHFDLIAQRQYA